MAASSDPGSNESIFSPGVAATSASRISRNARAARNWLATPTMTTCGGLPAAIWARTVCNGLGMSVVTRRIQTQRERQALPLNGASLNEVLRKESLFLKLLAVDAERRPGNSLQALLADDVVAVGANAIALVLDALERLVDQHEQVALAIGEVKVEFFRIVAGGL